jgi:hypothetical protein
MKITVKHWLRILQITGQPEDVSPYLIKQMYNSSIEYGLNMYYAGHTSIIDKKAMRICFPLGDL